MRQGACASLNSVAEFVVWLHKLVADTFPASEHKGSPCPACAGATAGATSVAALHTQQWVSVTFPACGEQAHTCALLVWVQLVSIVH